MDPKILPVDQPGSNLERGILAGLFPRMGWWMWASIAGVAAIWFFANHQVGVLLWKVVLQTVAAFIGYQLHRQIERGKRPHEIFAEAAATEDPDRKFQLESLADSMLKRRTAIICAAMLACALGT